MKSLGNGRRFEEFVLSFQLLPWPPYCIGVFMHGYEQQQPFRRNYFGFADWFPFSAWAVRKTGRHIDVDRV